MKKNTIQTDFEEFILQQNHPCVMAQSVFNFEKATINDYKYLAHPKRSSELLSDLENYIHNYDFTTNEFKTFIAVFSEQNIPSEKDFEEKLWQQLSLLSSLDPLPWDDQVQSDPAHKEFIFSLLGKSFYLVGMHPKSSRFARQSPYPALVFNLHWQFEKLREMGTYSYIRNKIRKRDKALQGSINPMLEDFGENSEARQYSGRAVDESWKCPFHNQ